MAAHARISPLPQRIVTVGWLSDIWTFRALQKQGVTHVAMHKLDSGRSWRRQAGRRSTAVKDDLRDTSQRRAFYRDLDAHAHRLWELDDGDDGSMNPGLLFYAVDPEK